MTTSPTFLDNSPRQRVKQTIRHWIQEGQLREGDRVPAEIKLAQQLGVSRDSVRSSLADLENMGVLNGAKNRTRVVASTRGARPSLLSNTIAIVTQTGDTHVKTPRGMMQVGVSARQTLSEAGRHVLDLHPSQLDEGHYQVLIDEPPQAVLIADGERLLMHPDGAKFLAALHDAKIPFVVSGDNAELQNYFLHGDDGNGDSHDKTTLGGFGQIGYQFPNPYFVEAKYQAVVGKADGLTPNGLLLFVGRRF